jgi:hypothetical protein
MDGAAKKWTEADLTYAAGTTDVSQHFPHMHCIEYPATRTTMRSSRNGRSYRPPEIARLQLIEIRSDPFPRLRIELQAIFCSTRRIFSMKPRWSDRLIEQRQDYCRRGFRRETAQVTIVVGSVEVDQGKYKIAPCRRRSIQWHGNFAVRRAEEKLEIKVSQR